MGRPKHCCRTLPPFDPILCGNCYDYRTIPKPITEQYTGAILSMEEFGWAGAWSISPPATPRTVGINTVYLGEGPDGNGNWVIYDRLIDNIRLSRSGSLNNSIVFDFYVPTGPDDEFQGCCFVPHPNAVFSHFETINYLGQTSYILRFKVPTGNTITQTEIVTFAETCSIDPSAPMVVNYSETWRQYYLYNSIPLTTQEFLDFTNTGVYNGCIDLFGTSNFSIPECYWYFGDVTGSNSLGPGGINCSRYASGLFQSWAQRALDHALPDPYSAISPYAPYPAGEIFAPLGGLTTSRLEFKPLSVAPCEQDPTKPIHVQRRTTKKYENKIGNSAEYRFVYPEGKVAIQWY